MAKRNTPATRAPKANETVRARTERLAEDEAKTVAEATEAALAKAMCFADNISEYKNADEAYVALNAAFVGHPYANARELAARGTAFRVTAATFEPGQGYQGGDRWNLTIVTSFGETRSLTLAANPTRAGYMTALAKIVAAFGATPLLALRLYEGKNGSFYALVPASDWVESSTDDEA